MSLPGVVLGTRVRPAEGRAGSTVARVEMESSLLPLGSHLSPCSASPPGCNCDPRGTLGGAAQCQPVSLRAEVLGPWEQECRTLPGLVPASPHHVCNGQCFCKPHVCVARPCAACRRLLLAGIQAGLLLP